MKKYCYFDGLLVIHPLISARYSSFTTSEKNSKHSSPPLEQTKHTQTLTLAYQTAPDKTYKRSITALLSLFWLLNNHRPNRKIIRLKGWRGKLKIQ